jgi:hypothetical protein
VNIELYRSLNNVLISKSSTSKEILDIIILENKETIRGRRNLTPKKVAKRLQRSYIRNYSQRCAMTMAMYSGRRQ